MTARRISPLSRFPDPGPDPVEYEAFMPDGKLVKVLSIAVRDADAWLAVQRNGHRYVPAGICRDDNKHPGFTYVQARRVFWP